MKKYLLLIFTSLFFAAFSQDFHYSQFYNSPLTLNPALTGLSNGSFRVAAIYRNQWWNTSSNFGSPAYSTPSISIDAPIRINKSALGLGLLFMNDRVGGGLMNDFHLMGSLSYIIGMGKNAKYQLSFGLQGAYTNRQFSNNLQFASQFQNNTFNSSYGIPEDLQNKNFNHIDVNAGLMWYARFSEKFSWYLGGGVFNISTPNYAYVQGNSRDQYMRFSGQTGFEIGLGKRLQLLPSVLYMKQNNIDQVNGGLAFAFLLGEQKINKLYVGGYTRSTGWVKNLSLDAAIAYAAIELKGFRLGMSYDYTLSSLQNAPNNTGGIELSAIYVHPYKKLPVPNSQLFCPRF